VPAYSRWLDGLGCSETPEAWAVWLARTQLGASQGAEPLAWAELERWLQHHQAHAAAVREKSRKAAAGDAKQAALLAEEEEEEEASSASRRPQPAETGHGDGPEPPGSLPTASRVRPRPRSQQNQAPPAQAAAAAPAQAPLQQQPGLQMGSERSDDLNGQQRGVIVGRGGAGAGAALNGEVRRLREQVGELKAALLEAQLHGVDERRYQRRRRQQGHGDSSSDSDDSDSDSRERHNAAEQAAAAVERHKGVVQRLQEENRSLESELSEAKRVQAALEARVAELSSHNDELKQKTQSLSEQITKRTTSPKISAGRPASSVYHQSGCSLCGSVKTHQPCRYRATAATATGAAALYTGHCVNFS
jgi:hypothetical protein